MYIYITFVTDKQTVVLTRTHYVSICTDSTSLMCVPSLKQMDGLQYVKANPKVIVTVTYTYAQACMQHKKKSQTTTNEYINTHTHTSCSHIYMPSRTLRVLIDSYRLVHNHIVTVPLKHRTDFG